MLIETEKEEGCLIIAVEGDVDAGSSILLDEALNRAMSDNETKILVSCEKLNYISSAGLGVFMSYLQDFDDKEIKMVLYGMSDKVKNVFKILGLEDLIAIVNDKQSAIQLANGI